jgi:hypothetical protein
MPLAALRETKSNRNIAVDAHTRPRENITGISRFLPMALIFVNFGQRNPLQFLSSRIIGELVNFLSSLGK